MKLVPVNGTLDLGNDFAPGEYTDHRIPSVQIITADKIEDALQSGHSRDRVERTGSDDGPGGIVTP
jgi:hypothetical protein